MDELSYFQNFLFALVVFINEARINYNQKMQLEKCLRFRQDKDYKYMSSLFIKLHASIQCWKIDRKDIADTSKLVKKFIYYFLVWDSLGNNA